MRLVALLALVLVSGCRHSHVAQVRQVVTPSCAKVELAEPCGLQDGKPTNCHFKMQINCIEVQKEKQK